MAEGDRLLIVEDTPSLQALYKGILGRAGYATEMAGTAAEARDAYARTMPRVVLMDLSLPDGDGVELIRELLAIDHNARFIVVTADGTVHRAVDSMRAGASEFLVKPFDAERLLHAVRVALDSMPRQKRTGAVTERLVGTNAGGFIGSSAGIARVLETIEAVSQSMAPVFVTGESGTGKELCARALHATSPRAEGAFVPVNCGAVSPNRLEIELFGEDPGTRSGPAKRGAAAIADGGTLFLDEVCELAPAVQVALLRFLQTSQILPLGASEPQRVDARIIAATNRDPEAMIAEGRLRQDLFYRLHVVPIWMPPLRDRGDDVLEIAEALLVRFNATEKRNFVGLSDEVKDVFRRYAWPGNIRQLGNILWNVMLLNNASHVTTDMLPPALMQPCQAAPADADAAARAADPYDAMTLAEAERRLIESAIARAGGSIPKAARALDVSASTIYRKKAAWDARDGG
jgi:DNA-binding NtrC family response regulator